MHNFLVSVECAIKFNGKFLFIKRPSAAYNGGLLAFPGGKVEYADGGNNIDILVQAVRREVLEEVGLDLVDPICFVTSSYFVHSNGEHVLNIVFSCTIEKSFVDVTPSVREVAEYYWLATSEALVQSNMPIWLKNYLAHMDVTMS